MTIQPIQGTADGLFCQVKHIAMTANVTKCLALSFLPVTGPAGEEGRQAAPRNRRTASRTFSIARSISASEVKRPTEKRMEP